MFLFGKNKLNKQVETLSDRFNSLKSDDIKEKIERVKMISESNEKYKELYTLIDANYNTLVNEFYVDIEQELSSLSASASTMDAKTLKSEIKRVDDKIDRASFEKEQINKQVTSVFEEETSLRDELTPLKEKYRTFVSDYEAHQDELGECSVLFTDAISSLDEKISVIEEALDNGKYSEAREAIEEFKSTLDSYCTHIEKMPQMVDFTFKVLPGRYEEVVQTYDSMKDEGYVLFTIKMTNYQDEIENLFSVVKQAFHELRYEEVKEQIKQIAYKINEISTLLEKEKESKENFDSHLESTYAFIEEINRKFLKAKRDFYSVNGVYLIDKAREDELIFIENELHSLSRIKMELETYLHSLTSYPYSVLNAKLLELIDFSNSINAKVDGFHKYIYSLKDDSQYAYKYVNDASIAITYYYNVLLSFNHKVLSIMYKDRYEEVTGLIDQISKELVTKPIYVEKINEELARFKTLATSLLDEMKESVKLYQNASNIIIYTNKYRSSFSVVNDYLNRAQIHFDNGEFEFAIDSVSEILQQVQPEAYAEMMRFKEDNNE